ncbi:hypothetical protein N0V95_009215 [Ascochyta clinopodiicola]|nr:hypothetical protein N0V95_009215 [Ascochyta clinopodiicola]
MPPPITFDSSEKVRILLRYALCWGLHIDHPDFAKKLAEHGIKTARKGGDGYVADGTIRSALTWYLGKDYTKLLPAYTIGKGESTLFEVRMRVLKHDSRDLEAALMNMNISDPARDDISKPNSCLNMSAVHPLDGDARVEDDLLTHMNGTLEQIRQDHQREQARRVESQQEEAKIESVQEKRTRREYASEGSERAKPRQDYQQNQEKIMASLQKALSKHNTLSEGDWVHIAPQPISSHEPRLNGTPPKASPLTVKVEEKNPKIQKQHHSRGSHYGIDPGVKDNMGRTVLNYLKPHAQSEESEDVELETEGTIFAIRDLDTGLAEHTLASWGIRTTSRVQSWALWLAEAASTSDKPLRGIDSALARAEAGAGPHDRDYYDTLGDTLLLAFITFVDPQTMPAQHVQETLRWILIRIPRVDLRNRNGLTPLQLAIHLALPHVVATLLHHISTHHGSAGSTSASEDVALQNSITVESYQVFEGAIFVEADAIICACLITNALAGKMFDESHEFRPLRERQRGTKVFDMSRLLATMNLKDILDNI